MANDDQRLQLSRIDVGQQTVTHGRGKASTAAGSAGKAGQLHDVALHLRRRAAQVSRQTLPALLRPGTISTGLPLPTTSTSSSWKFFLVCACAATAAQQDGGRHGQAAEQGVQGCVHGVSFGLGRSAMCALGWNAWSPSAATGARPADESPAGSTTVGKSLGERGHAGGGLLFRTTVLNCVPWKLRPSAAS